MREELQLTQVYFAFLKKKIPIVIPLIVTALAYMRVSTQVTLKARGPVVEN